MVHYGYQILSYCRMKQDRPWQPKVPAISSICKHCAQIPQSSQHIPTLRPYSRMDHTLQSHPMVGSKGMGTGLAPGNSIWGTSRPHCLAQWSPAPWALQSVVLEDEDVSMIVNVGILSIFANAKAVDLQNDLIRSDSFCCLRFGLLVPVVDVWWIL